MKEVGSDLESNMLSVSEFVGEITGGIDGLVIEVGKFKTK